MYNETKEMEKEELKYYAIACFPLLILGAVTFKLCNLEMLFFTTIFLIIFYIIGVLVYVRMKICEGISKELDKVFSDNDWHQVKFKEDYVPLERNTYIAYYYVRRDPSKPYILKLKKEKVYPRWYSPEKLTDSCVVPGRKETKVRIRYISYFFFKKKLKLVQN